VVIKVYDITGRESLTLLNSNETAGEHQHTYEIRQQLTAGVYFVQVEAGSKRFSQKMLVR
jgi:hypothetical protein